MHGNTLSILIPVYNEAATLDVLMRRVLEVPLPWEREVVAVDDGSQDGTWERLLWWQRQDRRVRVFRHQHNQGKGAAVRTAIAHMTGQVAVIQDADLEYDPAELPRLLQPILDGKADAVFGSRYLGTPRAVHPLWHTAVNRLLTWACNLVTNLTLTDMETCYKMIRADVLRHLRLTSCTFTLEPELTCRLAQWGARIWEVPISYRGRSWAEGKKIGPVDGIKALGAIVRYGLLDRRFTNSPELLHELRWTAGRKLCAQVHKLLKTFKASRVLFLGAGSGHWVAPLLAARQLVLVEPVEALRVRLQGRWGSYEHVQVLPQVPLPPSVPVPEEQYDLILCHRLEQIARQPQELLQALRCQLAPEGRLIVFHSPRQSASEWSLQSLLHDPRASQLLAKGRRGLQASVFHLVPPAAAKAA